MGEFVQSDTNQISGGNTAADPTTPSIPDAVGEIMPSAFSIADGT